MDVGSAYNAVPDPSRMSLGLRANFRLHNGLGCRREISSTVLLNNRGSRPKALLGS